MLCIDRVPYFSYLAKISFLLNTANTATFAVLKDSVTNWVTNFLSLFNIPSIMLGPDKHNTTTTPPPNTSMLMVFTDTVRSPIGSYKSQGVTSQVKFKDTQLICFTLMRFTNDRRWLVKGVLTQPYRYFLGSVNIDDHWVCFRLIKEAYSA